MAATVLEARPVRPSERAVPGAPPRLWKWTGNDLIRIGEAGLLPPEGRFELLDGEIYQLMPPGPFHACIVDLTGDHLEALARRLGAHVREEKPIRLTAFYDPQPDVAIVRGKPTDYLHRFPGPEDVLLAIEVADSSLQHDRDRKLPAYAAAGIPECWVVNLQELQVEVFRDPSEGGYRSRQVYRSGDTLSLAAVPDIRLEVSSLLGES